MSLLRLANAGRHRRNSRHVSRLPLLGFSRQQLWFWSGEKRRKKQILDSCEESPALQCEGCGAVTLPAEKSLRERVDGAIQPLSTYAEERSRTTRPGEMKEAER